MANYIYIPPYLHFKADGYGWKGLWKKMLHHDWQDGFPSQPNLHIFSCSFLLHLSDLIISPDVHNIKNNINIYQCTFNWSADYLDQFNPSCCCLVIWVQLWLWIYMSYDSPSVLKHQHHAFYSSWSIFFVSCF